MTEVVLDNYYILGMKDARDGKPARLDNKNYERGYSTQYQLDQITQGERNERANSKNGQDSVRA